MVCAVSDGLKIKKEGKDKVDLKSREKLYANEEGIPSFFDYWAYMYFVGASISGPWYEFKDFQLYMKSQGPYKEIPPTGLATLVRLLQCILFVIIISVLS